MDFEVKDKTLLIFWGFSVSTGWIVSYFLHSYLSPLSMIAFWTVLMSVPIISSIKWMSQNTSGSLPLPWMLTTMLGLVTGYAVVQGHLSVPEIETYAVFWFFLPASAFGITTYYFEGMLNHLYMSAALANFVMAAILLFQPSVMEQYYIMAAVFQGLPILYHAYYEF